MARATKETLSFQIDAAKRAELDHIAKAMDRDRSHVIREALDAFIELQNWHAGHISEGVRQADAGQVVDHSEVKDWVESWSKKKEVPRPTAPRAKRRA